MQKVENYMNDVKAAEYLGLAVQTLRNWRTQSRGPAYIRAGRASRLEAEESEKHGKAKAEYQKKAEINKLSKDVLKQEYKKALKEERK